MAATGILIEGLDAPPIEMKRTGPPGTDADPTKKRVSRIPSAAQQADYKEDETEKKREAQEEDQVGRPQSVPVEDNVGGGSSTSELNDLYERGPKVLNKIATTFKSFPSYDDMDIYDSYNISAKGKREEIVAWSVCTDEGYSYTLEEWGQFAAKKIREVKSVLMTTPILAMMAIDVSMAEDIPMGEKHRRAIRNVLKKLGRVIGGNMGTYPRGSKKLWRPQSLVDAEKDLWQLWDLLLIDNKLPDDNTLVQILELQMGELQQWLTTFWGNEYTEPTPPDIAADDLKRGLSSKLVRDFRGEKAARKEAYISENLGKSVAIKALQWQIDRKKGTAKKNQETTVAAEQDNSMRTPLRARQENRVTESPEETPDDSNSDSAGLEDLFEPVDHGALLFYGVSEDATQQLTVKSDRLQAPMPTNDPTSQNTLAQALEAVRIIVSNTEKTEYGAWDRLIQGYKHAHDNGFVEYAAFFMEVMQKLQYANVKTFNNFSKKKVTLAQWKYTDDATLLPPEPDTAMVWEVGEWYAVLQYSQDRRFEMEPEYQNAMEAVAHIVRSTESFDPNSWTTLLLGYRKASEVEGDPNTITEYLLGAVRVLYNINPQTRDYAIASFRDLLPAPAPAYDLVEEESQSPESQSPESQLPSDSEESLLPFVRNPLSDLQPPEAQLSDSQQPSDSDEDWRQGLRPCLSDPQPPEAQLPDAQQPSDSDE